MGSFLNGMMVLDHKMAVALGFLLLASMVPRWEAGNVKHLTANNPQRSNPEDGISKRFMFLCMEMYTSAPFVTSVNQRNISLN